MNSQATIAGRGCPCQGLHHAQAIIRRPARQDSGFARAAEPVAAQFLVAAESGTSPGQAAAAAPSPRPLRRRHTTEAKAMPALWQRVVGGRPNAAAPPGVRISRGQAAGDRIPAGSAALPQTLMCYLLLSIIKVPDISEVRCSLSMKITHMALPILQLCQGIEKAIYAFAGPAFDPPGAYPPTGGISSKPYTAASGPGFTTWTSSWCCMTEGK